MKKIIARGGYANYMIDLESVTGNHLIADEPVRKGGGGQGFSPKEILASALAACTNATVRIFANNKAWDLQDVIVDIELTEVEGRTIFNRTITFEGNLNGEERSHLLAVANSCPVLKILTHPITINTSVASPSSGVQADLR
jgi:putative redox protein